ncbi:MAG TPA: serine/threonine-protein kinase [Rhodanobacteraceae bacterium]|nr:serine/threonine-protein kinase [Rhodanobacteraceae bacterium]
MSRAADNLYLRAKEIVDAVFEMPPAERAAAMDARCGGDRGLRAEVMWLLEAAELSAPIGARSLLGSEWADGAVSERVQASAPRDYRIVRYLGAGGMGVVYLAERTDGDYVQQVALKFLNLIDEAAPEQVSRFLNERRILARLNHPNIAHLVDGGTTTEGRPFLAMEYVDGVRIEQWCASHALSLHERLQLFIKICEAVAYAHQHLIIHRDIKPANILVTEYGEPKLLDFGIARVLEGGDRNLRTAPEQRALTLAYASPEQIHGETLSTATDVYSLGAVLYQLVSGVRPFNEITSTHSLSNAIVAGRVTPPSHAKPGGTHDPEDTPSRKRERIPRDIDAIVLKAMRAEPEQRYATAGALIDDLRRHLQSRVVLARRGHWNYRASRFLYRHRWLAAAVVALVMLLGAFAVQREFQLRRIEYERAQLRDTLAFTEKMLNNADLMQTRGEKLSFREVVDKATDQFLAARGMAPEVRGKLALYLGQVYGDLGDFPQSAKLLDIATDSFRDDPLGQAAAWDKRGDNLMNQNDYPGMLRAYGKEAALTGTLPREDPDNYSAYIHAQIALIGGYMLSHRHNAGQIEALWRRVLAMLAKRPTSNPLDLSSALSGLAETYVELDDKPKPAIPLLQRAVAVDEKAGAGDSSTALNDRFRLARALARSGDWKAAQPQFVALAAAWAKYAGPDSAQRAVVLSDYADTLDQQRKFREVSKVEEETLRIYTKLDGADSTAVQIVRSNHALTLLSLGETAQAAALFGVIRDESVRHLDDPLQRANYARSLGNLGLVQLFEDHPDAAMTLIKQGIDALRGIEGSAIDTQRYLMDLQAQALLAQHQYGAAENIARDLQKAAPDNLRYVRSLALSLLGQPSKEAAGRTMLAQALADSRKRNGECNDQTLALEHPEQPVYRKAIMAPLPARCTAAPAQAVATN